MSMPHTYTQRITHPYQERLRPDLEGIYGDTAWMMCVEEDETAQRRSSVFIEERLGKVPLCTPP